MWLIELSSYVISHAVCFSLLITKICNIPKKSIQQSKIIILRFVWRDNRKKVVQNSKVGILKYEENRRKLFYQLKIIESGESHDGKYFN